MGRVTGSIFIDKLQKENRRQRRESGVEVMETKRKFLLAGLFLGLFFSALDQTVVGTAMPRIIGELGGLSIMTWVTTAYMLTSTTIVPIAGKLADLYGRRIIYVVGISIFMLGSALCGISSSMTQLILFRALQGIGGGIMMPLSMTIVGDTFPSEERGKWQGLIGAMFGLSSVVGPTIGGWIVDNSSWQWVFYVNLPIGLVSAVAIYLGLQGEKRLVDKAVIDYAGAMSLVAGTVSLLLGLNLGGTDYPWLSVQILGLLGLSLLSWIIFIRVENRAAEPILSLDLFKNRVFAITNIIGFLMGLGMFGAIMFLPLFLQGVIGASATNSGNTMIPMMLAMVVTSIIAGRFTGKFTFRSIFVAGMLMMAIGFYLLSTMGVQATLVIATVYIIVLGMGMGLIMPTVTLAVQSAFTAEKRGVATSATQFFRSIGGTLGMTILGVVFNYHSKTAMEQNFFPVIKDVPLLQSGPLGTMIQNAHEDPQALFNILLSPEMLQAIPPQLQQILLPPLKIILADSLHLVFLVAMVIIVIGMLASYFMGDARLVKTAEKPATDDAGLMLFAEGVATEVEIAAELVPDLLEERKADKQ